MLSDQEREMLPKLDEMSPKARGNMLYRVRQKVKDNLDEINEIILALENIPDKSAKMVVADEHVAAVFVLSEKLIDVLGYAPIEEFDGQRYVTRIRETRTTQPNPMQPATTEKRIKTEPATAVDEARNQLVRTHLMRLSKCIDLRAARIPSDHTPWSSSGFRIYDSSAVLDGANLAEEWLARRKPK